MERPSLVRITMVNPCLMEFGLVPEFDYHFLIATLINVVDWSSDRWWDLGMSKSIDRFMMEVYNVISNIPFMLIVIVLTYSMGAGFWNLILAMTLTGWIGIAYTIRVQIMRYRDLEYNLPVEH